MQHLHIILNYTIKRSITEQNLTVGHKRIIKYFLDHEMIRRTKTGKLYNISFKLDNQTDAGAYGNDFKAELKLDNLINLNTGEWII